MWVSVGGSRWLDEAHFAGWSGPLDSAARSIQRPARFSGPLYRAFIPDYQLFWLSIIKSWKIPRPMGCPRPTDIHYFTSTPQSKNAASTDIKHSRYMHLMSNFLSIHFHTKRLYVGPYLVHVAVPVSYCCPTIAADHVWAPRTSRPPTYVWSSRYSLCLWKRIDHLLITSVIFQVIIFCIFFKCY